MTENTLRILLKMLVLLLLFVVQKSGAQELNCNVIVNSERVQTQEKQIFRSMQAAIASFLNDTRWSDEVFEEQERIKCNLLINLKPESTLTQFFADVQIQSVRPVYGTDYEALLFNFNDGKWGFDYKDSDPLIFQENTFTTPLTSLLAYYAYIILALDQDSFAPKGGTPYLERALNILNNAQEKGGQGWTSFDKRDRHQIIENLNDPQFAPYRQALYIYHREALDNFADAPEKGREKIVGVLEKLKTVNQVKPLSIMINNFFQAKTKELKHIFSEGDMQVRTKAVKIISSLDPLRSSEYKKILR